MKLATALALATFALLIAAPRAIAGFDSEELEDGRVVTKPGAYAWIYMPANLQQLTCAVDQTSPVIQGTLTIVCWE